MNRVSIPLFIHVIDRIGKHSAHVTGKKHIRAYEYGIAYVVIRVSNSISRIWKSPFQIRYRPKVVLALNVNKALVLGDIGNTPRMDSIGGRVHKVLQL